MFWEELNTIDYVLVGVLLVLFFVQLYWYSRYICAPARRIRKDKKSPINNDQSPISEGVSVLLAAHNESYNLSQYLQALLTH